MGERTAARVGNAVCNAGGKLLKVVEMQHRYGKGGGANERVLALVPMGGDIDLNQSVQ